MTTEPADLDPRAQQLLAQLRDHRAMPPDSRERVWAKLASGPGPGDGGTQETLRAEPSPIPTAGASKQLAAAVGLGMLVAAGIALVVLGRSPPSPPEEPSGDAVVQATVAGVRSQGLERVEPPRSSIELPPRAVEQPAVERAPEAREPTSPAKPSKRARSRARTPELAEQPSAPTSSLAGERTLIEQAHAALAKGQPEQALEQLAEHERSYAEGVFSQEREALQAIALCKDGQRERGQTLARSFVERFPQAVLGPRVRKTCELEAADDSGQGEDQQ